MSGYEALAALDIVVRPFDMWPGAETPHRTSSQFSAGIGDTVELLARELKHLAAERVVLQLAIPESRLRLDGLPYADAKCAHPGVMLGFDSTHGPLRYACDRFVASPWKREGGADWTHNLRAIALGLEALRKVDRYGISKRGEQYRGYAELPAGIAAPPTHMTTDEAVRFIAEHGDPSLLELGGWDYVRTDRVVRESAYRAAAKRLHPDAPGGDTALFQRLQAAKSLLEREADRG